MRRGCQIKMYFESRLLNTFSWHLHFSLRLYKNIPSRISRMMRSIVTIMTGTSTAVPALPAQKRHRVNVKHLHQSLKASTAVVLNDWLADLCDSLSE